MSLPEFEQTERCTSRMLLAPTIRCEKSRGHGAHSSRRGAYGEDGWLHENGDHYWSDGAAAEEAQPDPPVNWESDQEVLRRIADEITDKSTSNVLKGVADQIERALISCTLDAKVFDRFGETGAKDAISGALAYKEAIRAEAVRLKEAAEERSRASLGNSTRIRLGHFVEVYDAIIKMIDGEVKVPRG